MKKPKTMFRRIHGGRHRGRKIDPFYNSAAWKRLRDFVLSQQPICADPYGEHKKLGEVIPSVDVDHTIPRKDRPDLELDPDNLVGMCRSCHGKKTQREVRSRWMP